ncbi:MaoC family dehydratase [Pokkaliibacter sp. CJK22405]|uniref:MaoC family dehydratase n=1 Tax=Pokkaliibacter sp. CJK22405 TaxID=3384615 RepID=UPI0039853880
MNPYHGLYLEDLTIGMKDELAKTVTETDITLFAGITGDFNPVHINEEFASQTNFGQRIAHGMLAGGFISAVLGTRLPGPGAIYLDQSLSFKAPVHIGDTVVASAEVSEIDPRRKKVTLITECRVKDKVVATGQAIVMVSKRPKVVDTE